MKKTLLLLPVFALALSACNTQTPDNTMPADNSTGSQIESGTNTMGETQMENLPDNSPDNTNETDVSTQTNTEAGVMVGGTMMTPDKTIAANAMSASNLTTLVSAVQAAGLANTLMGTGPYTVFAPTNAAFSKVDQTKLDSLMEPANKTQLQNLLKYHVVMGQYTAADLKDGMKLKTLQGEQLTVSNKNGQVMINGKAMVETADVMSSNGVSHVISEVLMPSQM